MLQGARWRHGCCVIDDQRMIILGGVDEDDNVLSSGFIYDAKAKQSSPLPNDIPAARYGFCAVANERYMYVIGGLDADDNAVNTLYRLSLRSYEWTTLTPMGPARASCAGVLLGAYIYIFGGFSMDSVERYSIVGNSWEDLPDMAAARHGHCAVAALRNEIHILGGETRVLEVFHTVLLAWKAEARLCDMPGEGYFAAAVVLKNRYLVVIGGEDEEDKATAGCLIYDCSINRWSSTPASMNMITARSYHTAAVMDGKIVVVGGTGDRGRLSSMECIDVCDVLEYTPLDYPLSQIYFDQILQLGKALLVSKHT